jgi:ceramide glucosyltransferase
MAKALKKIGLRTVFSHRPFRQELGRRTFSAVYRRQLRWSVIRRADQTFLFLLEPLSQALPAIAASYVAAPAFGLSPSTGVSATFAIWLAVETLLFLLKGWQASWLAPVIFLVREAFMLVVWLHAWLTNRVVWARNTLDVRAGDGAVPLAPPIAKEEG